MNNNNKQEMTSWTHAAQKCWADLWSKSSMKRLITLSFQLPSIQQRLEVTGHGL